MTVVHTGILLPESLLGQGWFHTFALFVAFNTIVYLGLTLSKLVPWPAQIHPDQVRAVLPAELTKDTTMKDIARPQRNDPEGDFVVRRLKAAAEAVPLALSLVAGLVIVIQTIVLVFVMSTIDPLQIAIYLVAVAMLIWAQVCAHARVPARAVVWSWSVLLLTLMTLLAFFGILRDDETAVTYAIMLLILMPVVAMSWPASVIPGSLGLGVLVVAGALINRIDSVQWSIAAVAAFGLGLVALEIRRNSTDRLLLEEMKSHLLATTDPLTRSMTRSALGVLAPSLIETAQSAGLRVHLVMTEIVGMRRTNADYGMDYGDAVIIAVGQAVRSASPQSDLIARWDGDCFVTLGIGPGPDAEGFDRRIDDHVAHRGIALGKRPILVCSAVVSAEPSGVSLEDLTVRAAEALDTRSAPDPTD